jgi:hypothetical protein
MVGEGRPSTSLEVQSRAARSSKAIPSVIPAFEDVKESDFTDFAGPD